MFTGIVTEIGNVKSVRPLNEGREFTVSTRWDLSDLRVGASVAHAGVCLTVTGTANAEYSVEAWSEALKITTLGKLEAGDPINLERSLRIGDELGGHMVTGHVDGTARIIAQRGEGDAMRFELEVPANLARFVAEKGSVCLDGTSLTVNSVTANRFDVLIIRHTMAVTTWRYRRPGDLVNLEVDRMARYAARLVGADAK